jgi:hypothetical protein
MLLMRMVVPVFGVITFASGVEGSQKSVESLKTLTPGRLGYVLGIPFTFKVITSVGAREKVASKD